MNIKNLSIKDLIYLININKDLPSPTLLSQANKMREKYYGKSVYVRGLIEFTNYCKNDCYYCGIRCGNKNVKRYRLSKEQILECVKIGHNLGFNTFVLQGGEDMYFTDYILCDIIYSIKNMYPNCALTLSVGERDINTYRSYKNAGADRYLLRHETATTNHYNMLHPKNLSLDNRKKCLYTLKELGFQVGAGFMVGSPYQTVEHLANDLIFLKDLQPHMVGLGPFIPHKDTKFKDFNHGTLNLTLTMLALTRLMIPTVLLPATTALGTIHPTGREQGLQAGANVVMPNLSPIDVRKDYSLYDNKICTGDESAQCIQCLKKRIESAGYIMDMSVGDNILVQNIKEIK